MRTILPASILVLAAITGYACSSPDASSLSGRTPSNGGASAGDDGGASSGASTPVTPASVSSRRIRRLTREEYANTLKDLLGTSTDYGASMPANAVVNGFDDDADALEVDPLFADQARQNAETIAAAFDLSQAGCAPSAGDSCAKSFVQSWGAKALRRPVTDDEVARYTQLFDAVAASGGGNEAGLRAIVEAMLQSPAFLYRTELGAPQGDGYALTPYEIASELSYLFWRTMPDAELTQHAQAGDLANPDVVATQATRLLASPRASAMLDAFVDEWLDVDLLPQAQKDPNAYPSFNDSVRTDMAGEAHAFFESVARDPNGTLATLLTSSDSFLTPQLAQFYGVPIGSGASVNGFVQTPMGQGRGGLLTLGSLLAVEAFPTGGNPVRRGKLVRVRLLCQDVSPPPPGLVATAPPVDPNSANRDAFLQHDTDPSCSGCHKLLDPIGFGFEQFDGVGRLLPGTVDSSGQIFGSPSSDGTFNGVRDLEQKLAASADVQACFAKQWVRFGLGVSDTDASNAEATRLAGLLASNGGKVRSLFDAMTSAKYFFARDAEVIPPP